MNSHHVIQSGIQTCTSCKGKAHCQERSYAPPFNTQALPPECPVLGKQSQCQITLNVKNPKKVFVDHACIPSHMYSTNMSASGADCHRKWSLWALWMFSFREARLPFYSMFLQYSSYNSSYNAQIGRTILYKLLVVYDTNIVQTHGPIVRTIVRTIVQTFVQTHQTGPPVKYELERIVSALIRLLCMNQVVHFI